LGTTQDNVGEQLRARNPDALSVLIQQFAGTVLALARRILVSVGTLDLFFPLRMCGL